MLKTVLASLVLTLATVASADQAEDPDVGTIRPPTGDAGTIRPPTLEDLMPKLPGARETWRFELAGYLWWSDSALRAA